jgi:SAM-dependent methyltransferase
MTQAPDDRRQTAMTTSHRTSAGPTTSPSTSSQPEPGYAFRDRPGGPATGHHRLLDHLAEMLDPFTRRRLAQAGVRAGARCLEIGAGSGTIAHWLARQAGPGGEVIATDLDPSQIAPHPRVTVLAHDIVTNPVPGRFDVIHARLVLAHLPERHRVLRTLAGALTPGGALVVEEFDASWDRSVLYAPDPDAERLFAAYHRALLTVLRAAGADPGWGRRVHHAMRQAGLATVDTEMWSRAWQGGQAGCRLPHAAAGQLRDRLLAAGISAADLDRLRALCLDPRLLVQGNTAVSTIGRTPR